MSKIGILFPHQLFEEHELHELCDTIYLVEEFLFFNEFNFHKQKIVFHRASMKVFEKHLNDKTKHVKYINAHEELADIRELIPYILNEEKADEIHFINPTDFWLEQRIGKAFENKTVKIIEYENPLFLNTRPDLESFFRTDKKSFFQTTWYKQERKKTKHLTR